MKNYMSIFFLFLLSCSLSSQIILDDYLKYKNRSYYETKISDEPIDLRNSDKVAQKLNAKVLKKYPNGKVYVGGTNMFTKYIFSFQSYVFKYDSDTIISFQGKEFILPKNQTLQLMGYSAKTDESKKVSRYYCKYLMSAYKQEKYPNFRDTKENWISLPEKNIKEFNKRNWIFGPYGLRYAQKDNPFVGQKTFGIIAFTLFEALAYTAIINGPLNGDTTQEKITMSLTGVGFWVAIKTLFFAPVGKGYIRNYNQFKSAYKVPKK